MKITSQRLSAALVAASFALFGLIGNATAGPKNVPFKVSAITQETLHGNPGCPSYLSGDTTGTGNASHLGEITFVATDCVTLSPSNFIFSNGRLTIYAANGDTLTLSYAGTLTPNPQPNSLSMLGGQFQITGGTGRFVSASGSGYLQGVENLATGQGQFDLVGTISY